MELRFKKVFDSFIVFKTPIEICNDLGEIIKIYGLLYNKEDAHTDDLWQWRLNRYIAYLVGCHRTQINHGDIEPDIYISPQGRKIELNSSHKDFIYQTLKNEIPQYTVVEFNNPLILEDGDKEDRFIISQKPINKYFSTERRIGE